MFGAVMARTLSGCRGLDLVKTFHGGVSTRAQMLPVMNDCEAGTVVMAPTQMALAL